ncbi:rab-like GTPase activating protein [Trypanosoma grayi]|uniref:rab-like GTPase activating protein n=1 Tax=Trypanosoma grayi TaxID=71804 RepID=UPI0004F48DEE|nr:rab-like GTPase activating protein [Trypanosoma grayi]KEG14680.1 rab-like GTPase activating protein [Trypanosoma grayi]
MTTLHSKTEPSSSPQLIPSSTMGRSVKVSAVEGLTDRFGFFIDAKEKAIEDEYIRKYPEMPSTQKDWAALLQRWSRAPYSTKKKYCRRGVPQSLRRTVWPLLLNSYGWAVSNIEDYQVLKSRTPVDTEVFAVIERDLGRTFPTHRWFANPNGVGQTKLRGILRAYANMDPAVGYVQGMGFLAATLLLQIEDEESTFWAFVSLMQEPKYSMASLYAPGFPSLYVCFHQLKKLMKHKCRRLLKRMKAYEIDPSVYATHWYLTLFSYHLSFSLLSRIWDMFLCEGWKVIHRVAITFLLLHEKTLERARDESDFLMALRGIHEGKDADGILKKALKVKFKTAQLLKWEAKFTASKRKSERKKGEYEE